MKALQLHYTSCRRGQSGHAGFQIRALTPGIRPDEQREIERRGVYRPPRDAAPEPAAEEIARAFPRAFRAGRLESGRLSLSRSGYSGRDYSGRWGNFFAHSLVLEEDAAPAFWPIDLYEWSGWVAALPPEEDTEEPPPPLPPADLGGTRPAESFRLAELREFLCEQPGRSDLLARMGRALLLGPETSRAVVIRDHATNVLYWIASLQKLFPAAQAWTFSSSTYQDDPRGCADLNGTTGETGFTFDESERRYRFYVFDLTAGQHSDVPEAQDDYPAVASRWLAQDPGRLERFHVFMQRFAVRRPAPELVSALHLFEHSEAPTAMDGERFAGMISFVARHGTAPGQSEVLELLSQPGTQELLRSVASPSLVESLLRIVPRQPEVLAAVSRQIAAAWAPEHTGRALARVLATLDPAVAQAVRRHLDQEAGFEILIGEWLEIQDRTPHPAIAFEEYRRAVLASLPGLERHRGALLRSTLLEALPEPESVPLAVAWLREQAACQQFPNGLAAQCLRLANRAVPLDPRERDGDGLALLVAETAAALKIALQPDRPFLRSLLEAAKTGRVCLTGPHLDAVREAVPALRAEDYEMILGAFLVPTLVRAATRGGHQNVLLATFTAARASLFERFYLEFFQAGRKSSWPEDLQAALRFWLGFNPHREELRPLAVLERTARKGLVLALSRLKPERLEEVRQNLRKTSLDAHSVGRWQTIEEELKTRERSPWVRFVGLFVRN